MANLDVEYPYAPPTYILSLTQEEAKHLFSIVGRIRTDQFLDNESREANREIYNALASSGNLKSEVTKHLINAESPLSNW